MNRILAMLLICSAAPLAAGELSATVAAEEEVYTLVNPDNGSGPFWSYGCTTILRMGEEVLVSKMETGPEVPPLANTRWILLKRGAGGWENMAEEGMYRQREPAVLAMTSPVDLYLNVNESIEPVGAMYKPARPFLIHFVLGKREAAGLPLFPQFAGKPYFTDHSYRGFSADPARGELLMLNIDAATGVEHACLMNTAAETLATGHIEFPIRACYPQVALNNRAVRVVAVGDIKEPNAEWQKYKFEQSGQEWDYVFRILYYAETPDITTADFSPAIEVANVDSTSGWISNKDLWVSPEGDAYILYTQREVQSAWMRDKFFPGKSIIDSLHLAVVRQGAVVERRVIVEGTETNQPGDARFHVAADGTVYAFLYQNGVTPPHKLVQIYPKQEPLVFTDVPLQRMGGTFLLSNTRAGAPPSDTIDAIGSGPASTLVYAQIQLKK